MNVVLTSTILSIPSIKMKSIKGHSVESSVCYDVHVTTSTPITTCRPFLSRCQY